MSKAELTAALPRTLLIDDVAILFYNTKRHLPLRSRDRNR